jgi:hypothetical protein
VDSGSDAPAGPALVNSNWIVEASSQAVELDFNEAGERDVSRHNLIIILILILLGVIPRWGHSRAWGYGPSGIVGLILIVVLILALLGKL